MKRAKLVEVHYYDFVNKLQRATDVGGKIEPKDKTTWANYINEYDIKEAAFLRAGAAKFSNVTPVIINHGGDWDGIYIYSKDEEACLKWVVEEI